MKNLHLDLVRVTEAGAISASKWVGKGNKEEADRAATEAMWGRLNQMDFAGLVAIGEGKKDKSHGLFAGDKAGLWHPRPSRTDQAVTDDDLYERYDIAIDPIEGTTPTAKGGYEAMSVIALANKDCFFKTEEHYLFKVAVGFKPSIPLFELNTDKLIAYVSNVLGKPAERVTVCMLDRPRHDWAIQEFRKTGCRIKLIQDCDVSACVAVCFPDSGIDLYYGFGGAPEAVIAASALKCLGGHIECSSVLSTDPFWCIDQGNLEIEDLVKGPTMFVATGITDGMLLQGVRYDSYRRGRITTHSIAMRSESGTIRRIETEHGN